MVVPTHIAPESILLNSGLHSHHRQEIVPWTMAAAGMNGLGHSLAEVHERAINMRTHLWVLATPIDGKAIDMSLVSQVRQLRKPKRPIFGMPFIALRLRTRIMNRIITKSQRLDVLQDVTVRGGEQNREHPALCRFDGEIGRFRQYSRQRHSGDNH